MLMKAAKNIGTKFRKDDGTAGRDLSIPLGKFGLAYAQGRFQRTLLLTPETLRKSRKSAIEAGPPQNLCNPALGSLGSFNLLVVHRQR